jgi:hypothetical protein
MELSDASLGAEQPVEAYLDDSASETPESSRAESTETDERAEPQAEAPAEPKARPAKKRGRASVPSWDEIMFGGGKND